MTKIDIISGFLGAGKTTLIKKLLADALKGQQVVLIENEFGEIGIDGGFLKEAGIEIREMNSGCICCSLVGDFGTALTEVIEKYHPDRIIIEPSGVGKLSDVIHAVEGVKTDTEVVLNCATTVVDVMKCKMYLKNFGEFFKNQVQAASTIILSRTDMEKATDDKIELALKLLRELNPDATIITTPVEELDGKKVLDTMEGVKIDLSHVEDEHHHHDHDENCTCGCHDHGQEENGHGHEHGEHGHGEHCHEHGEHGHEEHCHEHGEHGHGEHCHEHGEHGHGEHCHEHEEHGHGEHCHEHEEHDHGACCHEAHDHDENCSCGCHDHDHGNHAHHHADEVFTSWGRETIKKFDKEQIGKILNALSEDESYGMVLRAKGMVEGKDGHWIYFDMVPGEADIREGAPEYTGRICVIGSKLVEDKLQELFQI